uniref:BCAS3 domain-containing protein n=1 Tax=Acrobeloides nanus TaxID=290746 RepID=A0A914EFI6_9BILA
MQHSNSQASIPDVANSTPRAGYVARGQLISPQPIQEPTIVTPLAELVHEVIPQGSSLNKDVEPIQWVKIQSCSYDNKSCTNSFVILMGLARGYQIWLTRENGVIEEVISERKGPLKVGHLLPRLNSDSKDEFHDKRPLLALVDGNPLTSDNKFSSVSFLSLKAGNTVHTLDVDDPIFELGSSNTCFLVLTSESIVICDQYSLTKRHCISVPPPSDTLSFPSFALSDNLLAYLDNELHKGFQSCGGLLLDEDTSYSGQIMNAAKSFSKTVSTLSETVVSSFSSSSQLKNSTSLKDSGIVTIVNVNGFLNGNIKNNDNILAHFVAHEEPIGFLAFGTGGQLLLTCSQSSKSFHLYALHFHSGISSLGTVQHLYTLHRGNSAAKVIDCAFSFDNRWLSVATNHGTTHVFAINPYGGPATLRTHGGKFANKESRFERTAGLTSHDIPRSSPKLQNASFPITFKEHPALNNSVLSRTSVNPWLRVPISPLALYSVAQIKQRPFSAERVTAWASDNAPVTLSTSNRSSMRFNGNAWLLESNRRQAVAFVNICTMSTSSDSEILFSLSADGVLTTYEIAAKRERHNSASSNSSSLNNISEILSSSPKNISVLPVNTNTNKASSEMPVRAKVSAVSQWSLQRPRGSSGIEPPLDQHCPLVLENFKSNEKSKESKSDNWIRHIEGTCYSGPHRRIWMGPQFSFGVYTPTSHSSAQLFNPNDTHGTIASLQKCCPVLIDKNSSFSSLKCDTSFDCPSRIVCGSWSSESDFKSTFDDGTMFEVKERLEDAMRETTSREITGRLSGTNRDSGNDQDLLNISGMDL